MKRIFSIISFLAITMVVANHFASEQTSVGAGEMALVGASLFAIALFAPVKSGKFAYDTIGLDAARSIFTNACVAVYKETVTPTSFLRSFFPAKFSPTKLVSFDVKRANEKIAVDILKGTGSNLNKKTRSSLKTIEPPLYSEAHNVNELDIYDTAFGTLDPTLIAQLATQAAEELVELRNKEERAYEKQCADVLVSGVITLVNNDNIDFKRKAGSLVDLTAGAYWTVTTVDPMVALENAGKWIRENGKAQGGVYNVIMGSSALNAMLNNPKFQAKYGSLKDITLGEIREPQRMATGGTLHGKVTAGAYSFYVWSYPEGYTDANGTFQYYIPTTHCIVMPEVTNFNTTYALVPQLPGMAPLTATAGGAYVLHEYIDPKGRNHVQEVLSAGIAMPVAIDTIYTFQATAS